MPSWLMPAARQRSRCSSTILARHVADVLVADAGVVLPLRRREAASRREAQWSPVLVEEVLLLEAEPRAGIVRDRGAAVARMRRAVRQQHLAHHERPVHPRRIGEKRDGLEHAVRVAALCLACRAAVEAPERQLLERREGVVLHDLGLAAEVRYGLVAVEPDVFEFELGHRSLRSVAAETKPRPKTRNVLRARKKPQDSSES